MAGPLEILRALAYPAHEASGGIAGLFQGQLQGEQLRRQFTREDLQNALLELQLKGAGAERFLGQAGESLIYQRPGGPIQTRPLETGPVSADWLVRHHGVGESLLYKSMQQRLTGDTAGADRTLTEYRQQVLAGTPPLRPLAGQQTIATWLEARGMADTAENREFARQALLKEHEASQTRIAEAGAAVRLPFQEKLAEVHGDITERLRERDQQRKTESMLGPMETALAQMRSVLPALRDKGFLPADLPAGASDVEQVAETARSHYRQWVGRNDPDWTKWITNQGSLIGLDRNVYNDIGRGGQMMYGAVKKFSEHPPTFTAAQDAFDQWTAALTARRRGGSRAAADAAFTQWERGRGVGSRPAPIQAPPAPPPAPTAPRTTAPSVTQATPRVGGAALPKDWIIIRNGVASVTGKGEVPPPGDILFGSYDDYLAGKLTLPPGVKLAPVQ